MLYISEKNHIVVDVTKAPYFADPTGKTDSTAAICRAIDDVVVRDIEGVQQMRQKLLDDPRDNFRIGFENRKMGGIPTVIFPEDPPAARILYFPRGTYLISDTLTYSFENLKNLVDDQPCSDLNRFIHFLGEDMETTVIKLADNCHAFRYGAEKPMVSFTLQNGSNVNMMNSFEELTLDAGVGNSGAIGLRFDNSNTGKVQNVTIRSSDPSHRGFVALDIYRRSQSYMENIHIDGFEYGIRVKAGTTAVENLTVKNTLKTAITVSGGNFGICFADVESFGGGLYVSGGGMMTVLHSKFTKQGANGGTAVRNYAGYIYLRDFTTANYKEAMVNGYETVYLGDGTYAEYNTVDRTYQLFPTGGKTNVGLPIEKQPRYLWNGDRSIVAEVDDFGAVGDGVTDATAAIQAAMNSGREYVVFGEGRYLCSGEITIPATVRAINFMYCDFAITKDFAEEKEKGLFVIEEGSSEPLFMDDGFVFEKFYGYLRFIRHSAKRDLIVSDLHVQTGAVYFNTVGGSKILMDNVASTMGVFGGQGYGSVPCFRFSHGQKVWIRQFNPERSADNVIVEDGCDFWIFGFKTEGPSGKAYNIRGGSRAEIFDGHATIATDDGTPCIENENSSVFAYMVTEGCGPNHQFTVAVNEFQNGCHRQLHAHQMPPYGVEYYYIPGYVGIHEDK